jgi:uncharacterized membrane protein
MGTPLAATTSFQRASARIPWIDALRGIAIVAMIPANFSPYLAEPHALWLRIVGSYAAPIFIMLSTGMVILHAAKHDIRYYLVRGALIVGFGAFVDMFVWWLFPFVSFDVLNLIGLALPLIYISRGCSTLNLLCIGGAFFVAAPLFQRLFGYQTDILEIAFAKPYWPGLTRILKSWFVDGWFPIFPWLGYAFVGAAFFRTVFAETDCRISKKLLLTAVAATAIGFSLLFMPVHFVANVANDGILEEREDYSELFYPPTIPYVVSSLGVVLLAAACAQRIADLRVSAVLCLLGQYSLLIYILHQVMGAYLLSPVIKYFAYEAIPNEGAFVSVAALAIALAYCCCRIIERVKTQHPPRVLVWRMLFGKEH